MLLGRGGRSTAAASPRALHELTRELTRTRVTGTREVRTLESDLRMNRGKRVPDSRVRVTTFHESPVGQSLTSGTLGLASC